MSARKSTKWGSTEWRTPSGRKVYLCEGDEPHEVALVSGAHTDARVWPYSGPMPDCVLVDGIPYRPECPDEIWEIDDGKITAIVMGDSRFVLERR